jgi:predicted alpha/beta-fold hydrolase
VPALDGREYRPPWWYRGRHLQTVWGSFFRRLAPPPLRRERVQTEDGDFVDLDWIAASPPPGAPFILILHGLEGSSRSHYALGLLREVAERGWAGAVLHFRTCGGEINCSPRLYHSGDTADLQWVAGRLIAQEPDRPFGLVGVSLGGNVMLRWLGERGEALAAEVKAAVAISVPFDLAAAAAVLDRGLRRWLYTEHFLGTMRAKVKAKADMYRDLIDLPAIARARTFREWDRFVTAPLYGFADERDYWERCSSGPVLSAIRRPCLLINAVNDPFVPAASLPIEAVRGSRWLETAFVPQGGHAGFLEGRGERSWAERRAVDFLAAHVAAGRPTRAPASNRE